MDMGEFPMDEFYIHNYLQIFGLSLLYYDFILTFSDEVRYIWQQPKSGASYFFIINRYFSFFADFAVCVGNFAPFKSVMGCKTYSLFRQIQLIAAQVIVCAIVLLRTYALYGRDRRILILVLSVAGVLFVLACWSITGGHSDISISSGCHAALSNMTGIHVATAWEALFIYDSLIFTLTLVRTYRERRRYLTGNLNELVGLISRDGAIYFAVMACANAANCLTFYLLPPMLKGSLSSFASTMSVTMMSRVMLHMRQTTHYLRPTTDSLATPSTANSASLFFTSRFMMPSRPYYENRSNEEVNVDHVPIPPGELGGGISMEVPEDIELHQVGGRTPPDSAVASV